MSDKNIENTKDSHGSPSSQLKESNFAQGIVAFISGLIFAFGLGLGGMLNPKNVTGFLDIFGEWKPALAGVMGGAIAVVFLANAIAKKKAKPFFALNWKNLPSIGADFSGKAKIGAVLFGVGWGLSGLCPGPALVSLASLNNAVYIFSAAMIFGFLLHDRLAHNFLTKHNKT